MHLSQWADGSLRKIIISDNKRNVNNLIRNCNRLKDSRGLSCKSLRELAQEAMFARLAKAGEFKSVTIADESTCGILIGRLLGDNNFGFIPEESFCTMTCMEILKSINNIRLNTVTKDFIQSKDDKIIALKSLVELYEKELEKKDIYDYPRLMKEIPLSYDACEFAVIEGEEYTEAEEEFIKALAGEKPVTITTADGENNQYTAFTAFGIAAELEYIAGCIKENNIPLDSVNIYYSNDEYESYIHSILGKEGFNHSFLTGTPFDNSLDFIKGLLELADSDFRYSKIERIVLNPNLGNKKIKSEYYRAAKNKKVAMGLDSFRAFANNGENNTNYSALQEFLKDITDVFDNGDVWDIAELYENIIGLVKKYIKYISKKDSHSRAQALTVLYERLPAFKEMQPAQSLKEATALIAESVKAVKVQEEKSDKAISLIKLDKAQVPEREYNFFVGLSKEHFNNKEINSPVLSDEELKRYLNRCTSLVSEENEKKKKMLLQTVEAAGNMKLFFSYSRWNTLENREYTPSLVYTELCDRCHSLDTALSFKIKGDSIIDYNAVAGWETEPLEEKEYSLPSEYSATTLESLFNCAIGFYYKHVRYVPAEIVDDFLAEKWLSPLEKGNLYHTVFEKYCKTLLIGKKEVPEFNEAVFKEIFEGEINALVEAVPYISEHVFISEGDKYKAETENYLKNLHKELAETGWRVEDCEYVFDDLKYKVTDDLEITLNGKIDRIDSCINDKGEKIYRVIDYKTGKFDNVLNKVKKGTEVQHIVYALAMKKENKEVDCALYVSPADNREEECKVEDFSSEQKQKLIDVLVNQKYGRYENTSCEYCDYKDVCGEAR